MPTRRPVAVLVLLLVPLLAGCMKEEAPAAATDDEGASGLRPALVAPTFLPPIELGVMDIGAEPNVAVAPDGTVYVTTPGGLWRSSDLGMTYEGLGEKTCLLVRSLCDAKNPGLDGIGDGSLAVTPDGVVHWAGLSGEDAEVPYQRSLTLAETWSDPIDLATSTGVNGSDRQWISADDDGALYVVWRENGYEDDDCIWAFGVCYVRPDATGVGSLQVNVSLDGGGNWTRSVIGADGITGPIAANPSSDAIYLPVNRDGLSVLKSIDRGRTWTETPLFTGVAFFGFFIFPVAAVDAAGNVYVVWSQDPLAPVDHEDPRVTLLANRPAALPHVYLAVSRDGGASFSEPLRISSPDRPAIFPWIAAGDEGRVVIAWYDALLPTPGDRLPNAWNVAVAMSVTADQDAPVFETALATPEPIHVGSICASGSYCLFTAGDRSLLDFFEVRLLPDGSPVLAFAGDADVRMATAKIYATRMTEGTKLRG